MRDSYNDSLTVKLLQAADLVHVDTQSNYVDLAGWDAAKFCVHIATQTGIDSSNYVTPILQEATATPASASSYSAVASTDYVGGFTKADSTSEDDVIQVAGYTGSARYVNVKIDFTGTGITAGIVCVWVELTKSRKDPASAKTAITGTVT